MVRQVYFTYKFVFYPGKKHSLYSGFLFFPWSLVYLLCEYFFRNYSKIHVGVLKSGMRSKPGLTGFPLFFFNSIWICTQSRQRFGMGTWQWSAFSLSQWVKGLWVDFTSQPEHCQDNFPYININIQSRSMPRLHYRVC